MLNLFSLTYLFLDFRLHLSDGISTLIAMITDKVDKVTVSHFMLKPLCYAIKFVTLMKLTGQDPIE